MKQLLISCLILISVSAAAQKDTIEYNGIKFYKGATVKLWYGSKPDKSFSFIYMGSGLTGFTGLNSGFSKYEVMIDKVYVYEAKKQAKGKLLNSSVNALGGNKILIDIEGAIDNQEIKIQQ